MFFGRIKSFFIDMIFPCECIGCGREGRVVCLDCMKSVFFLEKRLRIPGKFYFDELLACTEYEKNPLIKKMLIRFKYKFDKEIALILAQILKTKFLSLAQSNDFLKDVIFVPVPLHKKRLRYRGFNQSQILAEYLLESFLTDPDLQAQFKNLKIINCLKRRIYRKPQADSNKHDRIENMKNVINIDEKQISLIKGRTVVVIDDVATTCSTINECAKVLKNAGVPFVYGFVLAKA